MKKDTPEREAARLLLGAQQFADATIESYAADTDATRKVKEAIDQYTKTQLMSGRSLVLYGETGTAKTMLAACVWNEFAWQFDDRRSLTDVSKAGTAENLVWVRGDELPGLWINKDREDLRTASQVTYHLETATLAVLDDLDKCPPQDNWANRLMGLIDSRVAVYQRPTIITTNLTPREMANKYGVPGKAMVDRLIRNGACFVRTEQATATAGILSRRTPRLPVEGAFAGGPEATER